MIGVQLAFLETSDLLAAARQADERGVDALWMTQSGLAPDTMMLLGAAAMVTERIRLGTSIIPTWPRAPILIGQQAMAMAALAPGRFRLGIGPSTPAAMEPLYGVEYRRPMTQLREYLTVLRTFLHEGTVDFKGEFVSARARLRESIDVPVMASALSPGAFRVCGELADGAISWMAPWQYLRDLALPALREGAQVAGREAPPLVAHVPVCMASEPDVVRAATQDQVGAYGRFPMYQAMFKAAGYGDVEQGYSQPLIDELVLYGPEESIIERMGEIRREGANEIMAHCVYAGTDRRADLERFFKLIVRATRELA